MVSIYYWQRPSTPTKLVVDLHLPCSKSVEGYAVAERCFNVAEKGPLLSFRKSSLTTKITEFPPFPLLPQITLCTDCSHWAECFAKLCLNLHCMWVLVQILIDATYLSYQYSVFSTTLCVYSMVDFLRISKECVHFNHRKRGTNILYWCIKNTGSTANHRLQGCRTLCQGEPLQLMKIKVIFNELEHGGHLWMMCNR